MPSWSSPQWFHGDRYTPSHMYSYMLLVFKKAKSAEVTTTATRAINMYKKIHYLKFVW